MTLACLWDLRGRPTPPVRPFSSPETHSMTEEPVMIASMPRYPTRLLTSKPGRSPRTHLNTFLLTCAVLLTTTSMLASGTAYAQCTRVETNMFSTWTKSVAPNIEALSSLPLRSARPRDRRPRWSRKDVSWAYATGRANVSTFGPLFVGSLLGRFSESERLLTAGLGVMGAGLLVGPAMGQWCLGGRYARESILPTLVRAAGEGEVIWAMVWGRRQIENAGGLGEGLGAMLAAGVLALPGILVTGLGVSWAMNRTPRLACDSKDRSSPVSVAPVFNAQTGGSGVGLSIQL